MMNLDFSIGGDRWRRSDRPLVLVVEREEEELLLVSHILELVGCSYAGTANGEEAFRLAKTRQPAAILIEPYLRDNTGIDLVRRLKNDVTTRRIPLIALTVLATVDDLAMLREAGCHACLTKPYAIEDLEATLYRQFLAADRASEPQKAAC